MKYRHSFLTILIVLLLALASATLFACDKSDGTTPQTSNSDGNTTSVQVIVVNGWAEGCEASYNETTGKFSKYFDKGTELTLVHKTASGADCFTGWYRGTVLLSASDEYTFTVEGKITISASFKNLNGEDSASLTVGNGTIDGESVTSRRYVIGSAVTVTASAAPAGKVFDGWYVGGQKVSSDRQYSFSITADTDIQARFVDEPEDPTAVKYDVTVTGGYIVSLGNTSLTHGRYKEGTEITVKPTVPTGKRFSFWTINASSTSATAEYKFKLTKDTVFVANFTDPVRYSLTVDGGSAKGFVAGESGAYLIEENTSVTVIAEPGANQLFDGWEKDGVAVTGNPGESYTFVITADCAFTALFVTSYSVAISGGAVSKVNGAAISAPSSVYPEGTQLVLSPTVKDGDGFVCWVDGVTNTLLSTDTDYSFTLTRERSFNAISVALRSSESVCGVTVVGATLYDGDGSEASVLGDGKHHEYSKEGVSAPYAYYKPDQREGWDIYLNACVFKSVGTDNAPVGIDGKNVNKLLLTRSYTDVLIIVRYTHNYVVTVADGYFDGSTVSTRTAESESSVTVVPKTIAGKEFRRWERNGVPVDPSEYGTGNSYTFTVYGDTTVSAVYNTLYTVSVTDGEIVVEDGANVPSASVYANSYVTVKAADLSAQDKVFKYWRINGADSSTDGEYTFRVTENTTAVAVYSRLCTVSVLDGSGTVKSATSEPAASVKVESGETLTLTATVPKGYRFSHWEKNGERISSAGETHVIHPTEGSEWKAIFTELCTVAVTGGEVYYDGVSQGSEFIVEKGGTVTVKPDSPAADKLFKEWTAEGVTEPVSSAAEYSFEVNANVNLTAVFGDAVLLTVVNGRDGGAQDVTTVKYLIGTSATATATGTDRRQFSAWKSGDENGATLSSVNPYVFTINEATTLYAQFDTYYLVTLKLREGSRVVGTDAQAYLKNEVRQTLSVKAGVSAAAMSNVLPEGYAVVSWEDSDGNPIYNKDGVTLNTSMILTIAATAMVKDLTYTVKVTRQYSLTVTGGTITAVDGEAISDGSTSGSYATGTVVTVTAPARNDEHKHFLRWRLDGTAASITPESTTGTTCTFKVSEDITAVAEYGLVYSQTGVLGSVNASEENVTDYAEYSVGSTAFCLPGLNGGENVVIQGIDYCETLNWIIISGYISPQTNLATGNTNSVLFVVDMTETDPVTGNPGKLVKEVFLCNPDGSAHTGKVGGVAVTEKNVFVASNDTLYRISLSKLTVDETTISGVGAQFDEIIPVPVSADFCSYDSINHVLWVGEYETVRDYDNTTADSHKETVAGVNYTSWTVGYVLSESDGATAYNANNGFKTAALNGASCTTPDYVLKHVGEVQGLAVAGGKLVVSRSWGGQGDVSELQIYANEVYGSTKQLNDGVVSINGVNVKYWYLNSGTTVDAPPLTEDFAIVYDETAQKYYAYIATSSTSFERRSNTPQPLDQVDVCWRLEIVQ